LRRARIDNVDRDHNVVTKEYRRAVGGKDAKSRTAVSIALRYTQSRRGNAKLFAAAMRKGSLPEAIAGCTCGRAYRAVLDRAATARRVMGATRRVLA